MAKRPGYVVAFVFLLGLSVLVSLHVYLLDGLDGWVFGLGLQEDTVYAAGYSDRAFRQVTVGMGSDEVLRLLGEPLRIRTDPYALRRRAGEISDECWAYTVTPGDTNYRQRLVCFRNGIVSAKESSLWVD